MKILHLSDTTLSGSPIRIVNLFKKYTNHEVSHIVWEPVAHRYRVFPTDKIGPQMSRDEIQAELESADVIHYHNRWARQRLFHTTGLTPPKKPSVIQIHSPRDSENFSEEIDSGIPLAVIAQYHVRQWPELTFEIPNVVDIHDPTMVPKERSKLGIPLISYAPSNWNAKGWDDKGYSVIHPILKRMWLHHEIFYDRIVQAPFEEAMKRKQASHLGVDEIVTGSYHLSSLEYLSMGIACFANIDPLTEAAIKRVTGCVHLPWIVANPENFHMKLREILWKKNWRDLGVMARNWMEFFWAPQQLIGHYERMYAAL